jgi:hypothetical protein
VAISDELPVISFRREFAKIGGLLSYGPILPMDIVKPASMLERY